MRACHLILAFAHGCTNELLGQSLALPEGEDNEWTHYYVNCFVDCDMAMQFSGGGVGHSVHYTLQDTEDNHLETGDEPDAYVDADEQGPMTENENASHMDEINASDASDDASEGSDQADEEDEFDLGDDDVDMSDNCYASA
ncbi:hypothetical protein K439DRAFT_1619081 [Ramaria rubella]|nr:hypothetical protein K439DRAFT_1619081 [Ramaria rubella]